MNNSQSSDDADVSASQDSGQVSMPPPPPPLHRAPAHPLNLAMNALTESRAPEDPDVPAVITKRVFPEILPWKAYNSEEDFLASVATNDYITDTRGIAGTFWLLIHESWRCRDCLYTNQQVWFTISVHKCPRCRLPKLRTMTDDGNVYQARRFTDGDDGATVFEDLWVEKKDLGFVFSDFFDEMARQEREERRTESPEEGEVVDEQGGNA